MDDRPPTLLRQLRVESFSELFERDPAELVEGLDRAWREGGGEFPMHEGDAVLTVMTLRAISALDEDVRSLDKSAGRLKWLTVALVVLTVVLLVITAVDIFG